MSKKKVHLNDSGVVRTGFKQKPGSNGFIAETSKLQMMRLSSSPGLPALCNVLKYCLSHTERKAVQTLLYSPLLLSARKEPQPLDAALLHLVPPHRQLLRPQHVRRRRRGELPQVPAGSGRGGGAPARREEAQNDREKAQE